MGRVTRLFFVVVLLSWAGTALAKVESSEKPPLPYFDWGACPFECCTYRKWQVKDSVTIYKSRNQKAGVAFRLKQGEWVTGVTGVVVTKQFGISKILKPLEIGYPLKKGADKPVLSLKPGEFFYPLHYLGEGFDLFWYKGNIYSDQISGREPDPEPPPPELNVQVVSLPKTVWWVKIRNKAGLFGWTDEVNKFDHQDACE